jgi:undecaprenyl-diphosphatase
MDGILLLKSLILGVVEGITEFIPVSSTGHLILAGDLIGFDDEKAKAFEVFIQLRAILSVLWLYREKIFGVIKEIPVSKEARSFAEISYCIPSGGIHRPIGVQIYKGLPFNPVTVAGALIAGGIAILTSKRWTIGLM